MGCCLPTKSTDVNEASNKSNSSITQVTSKRYERISAVTEPINHQSEPLPVANGQQQVELTKLNATSMVATTASLTSSSSIINSENAVTPSAVNTTSSTTTSTTLSASSKSRVVGVVRESMRIDPVDHATSEHDSQPASSSSRQMPSQSHLNKGSNGIVAAPSLVGSNDVRRAHH